MSPRPLSSSDCAARRDVLAAEREAIARRVAGLARELDAIIGSVEAANTDDEHDPEGQTIGFERAQVAGLLADATARLADLDRATRRLRDGTYGDCVRCGAPIGIERLRAAPLAETCIQCATAAERTRSRGRAGRR